MSADDPGRRRRAGDDAVTPDLLERLVCPATRSPLRFDASNNELVSNQARLAYPIRDGVPVLLIEYARPLD
ncbi:hypothetical protein C7I55_04395 [Sphingomonas deserti]|uniref:UPF0434 protein C7I55_04395 n=1 Tax=Allosphingosinicella deserti TaxID=2116704 RepID=A0A2P7QUB5_9SPHN|nr:hypothetical protein C7I55_04395 [Sphingomonas deserti]